MPIGIVLNVELVDWRVGEKEIEDAPERHWPVKLASNARAARPGKIQAEIKRPDGSTIDIVLELEDDVLALRVWVMDPHGDWVEGGEPILNTKVWPDNTIENVV